MKFGLAISSDVSNSSVIVDLSNELESFFKEKNYGESIKMYTIGIACVSPQFEPFFKLGKPSYTKGKKTITLHGVSIVIEDAFACDIKIDFETFKNGTVEECRKILAKEILNSLSVVKSMKSKIKDFDIEMFKKDLEDYFIDKKLL